MLTLAKLNAAMPSEAIALLDGLYEHSPWIAEKTLTRRSFASLAQLKRAFVEVLADAGRDAQLALIRVHPELAGKAMVSGTLTAESTDEQSRSGLTHCTPDEFKRVQELNAAYNKKFGFPFILAVKGYDRAGILREFERRVGRDPAVEFEEALKQVARITRFRLDALLGD